MNLKVLQQQYGITAKNVTSLRSNVAVIETEHNQKTIIKRIRNSRFSNWLNKHRFYNELRIYKAINAHQFKHLHAPELIQVGDRHMVLQFVEKDEATKTKTKEFLQAYYEMQTLNVPKDFWFDFKNQLVRGFYYKGVVVPLLTLSRHLKITTVFKMIFLFLTMQWKSKKLANRYWLHGDITSHNVYHNMQDGKLYFLDFENLFYTRKWPLIEIIQKCFWLQNGGYGFHVNTKMLQQYLNITKEETPEINQLSLKQQFRFSLLINCISNIAIAKSKIKRESYIMLLNILLNKKSFDNWYSTDVINH